MGSLIVLAAVSLIFSGFDAFMWKRVEDTDWEVWYRGAQIALQLALYSTAYAIVGFWCAGACALLWFTGGCDVLYYWWKGLDVASDEASGYPWLWWTAIGLYRCAAVGKANVRFRAWEVYTQAGIGAALAFALTFI